MRSTPVGRACAIACATSTPRIRRQINVFVDGQRGALATPLASGARVIVMMAIVGG